MGLPKRKHTRLREYDYSQNGAYFVTICTKNKKCILSKIVGYCDFAPKSFHALPQVQLSPIGMKIEQSIEYINQKGIVITKYVIMPNHIHLLIELYENEDVVGHGNPTLQKIVGELKSYTTKCWNDVSGTRNEILWQRSFHDHIIRNRMGYEKIWQYIDTNPDKWMDDCYYKDDNDDFHNP